LFEMNGQRLAIADSAQQYAHDFLTKTTRSADIHFLFDYLDGLEPGQWRALFPFIATASPSGERRWKQLFSLVQHVYNSPTRIVEFVESLPVSDDHRAVFRLVYDSPECALPFDEIAAAFDFHPSKLEHVLLELERYAVLFEQYHTSKTEPPHRWYSLLKELAQFMLGHRHKSRKTGCKPPAALNKEPSSISDEGLGLAYSVSCLVAHLRTHTIRLTRTGAPHRTDLRGLVPLLNVHENSRIDGRLICAVAMKAGLAEPDRDGRYLLLTKQADGLAELSMIERQKMLFEAMLREHTGYGDIQEDVVELLGRLEHGVWYKLADVVKYARRLWLTDGQPLDAFRLYQQGPNWHYSLPPDKMARLDCLKRYLSEPLYLAGGAQMSLSESEPERLSLTPLSSYLTGVAGPETVTLAAAVPEERALVVQPNYQVVVGDVRFDPLHYATLDTFCTRDGSGWATVFRLDKQSVTCGIQTVGSVEPFVEFLRRHNKHGDIPANVESTLRGWDSAMKRVRVRRLGLIEAEDDLVLMELLSRKKFKKYLDEKGRPAKFVVFDSISTTKLKKLLEEEGYLVE